MLTMNVDSLEWPVMVLAEVDADFEVESPPELTALVSRTADRLERCS